MFLSVTFLRWLCCAKMLWTKNAFFVLAPFFFAFLFFCTKNTKEKDAEHLTCWTFSFGKCSASHFPKENVQHQQNVRAASNTFLLVKCYKGIWWSLYASHRGKSLCFVSMRSIEASHRGKSLCFVSMRSIEASHRGKSLCFT